MTRTELKTAVKYCFNVLTKQGLLKPLDMELVMNDNTTLITITKTIGWILNIDTSIILDIIIQSMIVIDSENMKYQWMDTLDTMIDIDVNINIPNHRDIKDRLRIVYLLFYKKGDDLSYLFDAQDFFVYHIDKNKVG